jgi:xylulokinase
MYAAVGTGNVTPGVVTISLGTSGTAFSVMKSAWVDPTGEIASFCDSTGWHLPLLCVSNMANGYEAVRRKFDLSHADFVEMVGRSPAGNEGRLLIPWYEGERTPDLPLAAPIHFGFGVDDFTAERLTRAALEGHVLNLHAGFENWPVQPTRLHVTGGLARSAPWCQTLADIFEIETVPVEGEGAALGAALHAAWVWGRENGLQVPLRDLTDAFVQLAEDRRCQPEPGSVERHRIQRALFTALSRRVRGLDAADPFVLRTKLAEMGKS